jgi:alanine racemase
MAIDVTKVHDVKLNSNVFLIKKDDNKINVNSIADKHDMFVNQFISMIGAKVEHVYFFEDKKN